MNHKKKHKLNLAPKKTTREDWNIADSTPPSNLKDFVSFQPEKNREKNLTFFLTCQLAPETAALHVEMTKACSAASVGQLPTTSLHDIGHAHRESDEKVVRHVMHLPGQIGLGFWSGFFGSLSNQQEDQFGLRLSATFKE